MKIIENVNFERTWNQSMQLHKIDPRKKGRIHLLALIDVLISFEKKLNEIINILNNIKIKGENERKKQIPTKKEKIQKA